MKHVLLATTALAMTASFAAAEVSFSGKAQVAIVDDNGAFKDDGVSRSSDMQATSGFDLDIGISAASDNGVTMSLGFDMGAGELVDYDDDDQIEAQGKTIGDADVSVSYAGITVTVDQNGIDNLFDDTDGSQDMQISGSAGGVAFAFTSDWEGNTSSYSVGGSMGPLSATLTGTDKDDANGDATGVSLSYAMGDMKLSASSSDESNNAEDDLSVGFSYTMGDLTASYTSIRPGSDGEMGDEYDAKVSYSAGALSASVNIDEADASTIIANYNLGGGATAFAAMHDKPGEASDLTAFGLTFSF
jgi:outer membrane protein OmpU